jgi:excinuclease ABC subunit C
VARRNRDGRFLGPKGKIYGPFVRGSSKYLTVGLFRKLFKIRICNKLPNRPCLEYFINNCDAPCINKVTREQYMEKVQILQNILQGKSSIEKFARQLQQEMNAASAVQQYERAKEIRDTLHRLDNLRIKQKMEKATVRTNDEEYVGIVFNIASGIAHVMTLSRTHGVMSDRKKFEFDLIGDNSLASFLFQYYSTMPSVPRFIYTNQAPTSKEVIEAALEKISGHKVDIIVITEQQNQFREKRELMDLVLRNLNIYLEQQGASPPIIELKKELSLSKLPLIIDCFDISNFGSTFAVGSCTRFVNGRPYKSGYRRFKVKTMTSQNDFAMIHEIVKRRYNYTESKHILPNPDLIIIDGGRGQLNAATSALREVGLSDIKCISLAKENEEVYTNLLSAPIIIPRTSPALKVIQHIRDEAHRFGLMYNISLRKVDR